MASGLDAMVTDQDAGCPGSRLAGQTEPNGHRIFGEMLFGGRVLKVDLSRT